MLASEVMTEDPHWVGPETSAGEAMQRLVESRVHHLPVLDDGKLIGMLSDRDLRTGSSWWLDALASPQELGSALAEPASSLMSSEVFAVAPNSDLKDAVDLMIEHHIGAVPVVDPESNKLVGIISYVDVLRATRELIWGI